jgi:uncharacterized RDD family membrane protein YckC
MQSSEPIETHFVNDPRDQAAAGETWRAEVASRVSRYRARRNGLNGDENSLDRHSGPAANAQSFDAASHVSRRYEAQNLVTRQGGESQSSALPARSAFDTNYYRRLNAESIAQSAYMTVGRTGAATALACELPAPEFEAELEAESSSGIAAAAEACNNPALDLEIRPRAAEDVAEDSFLERYCISEPPPQSSAPVAQPPSQTAAAPVAPAQGNLIVFRRPFLEPPLIPQPSRDELADPVNRRPRILEVPEDIMPTVQDCLFPEIRLDADEQEEASDYREPAFDVPLRVARVSERLMASFTDMSVVVAAGLLFAAIAWRALPEVPHTKPFFMVLGAVTLLLWAVYQHLFLLYAGRTPGMCMRGIRLSTFDGRVPEWKQRSSRARFMFISFASVALGFLWALVDEDTLCWHDRISKTFLTTE